MRVRLPLPGFFMEKEHPIYKQPIWKIYGPYQSKQDLRRRIMAYDGQQKITISYPKYLMECELQRQLNNDEEVHHKNGIEFDDRLDNYEIRSGTKHRKEHQTNPAEYFNCPTCGEFIVLEGLKLSRYKTELKRKPGRKGPYCNRRCAGKDNN